MKKVVKSLLVILFLLTLTFMFFVGCGTNQSNSNEFVIDDQVSLSVWITWPINRRIETVYAPLFSALNPFISLDVSFIFITHFLEQRNLTLMAGNAPDMFLLEGLNYHLPDNSRLLADWRPVMESHPDFNPDDYFMNVFEAVTGMDGRLTAFPTNFFFGLVAANTTVPGLVDALAQTNGVNEATLMNLAQEFGIGSNNNPLYIHPGFTLRRTASINWMTGGYIQSFLDIQNIKADFDNLRFISFIENTLALTTTNPTLLTHILGGVTIHSKAQTIANSERYMFMNFWPTFPQMFLPIYEPVFAGHTPITNHLGELAIFPWVVWGLNINTSTEQQQAAWEFIRFMQQPERIDVGSPMIMVSTYKPHMRHDFSRLIHHRALLAQGWQLTTDTFDEALEAGIALIENIGSLPMTDGMQISGVILDVLLEVFDQFEHGFITAEQAAEDLQSRMTLMLMEMNW